MLLHVSDRMVSINLCGRRRRSVMNRRSLTSLPLNQEPSLIYCSQRSLLVHSRKITQEKNIHFVFSGYSFFTECFYSFNYASALLLFRFVLGFFFFLNLWRISCFISVQEQRRENTCCLSESVLCSSFIEPRMQQGLTGMLYFEKGSPVLHFNARWNNCTVQIIYWIEIIIITNGYYGEVDFSNGKEPD